MLNTIVLYVWNTFVSLFRVVLTTLEDKLHPCMHVRMVPMW
jgi:hypothetical protein